MPGHKLGTFGDMKTIDFTALDVTEANGLDNLYEAEGIIKEALEELSRFYKSKETLMLTNGSTTGILASILALCKPGEEILVARNCHHSVWHALILSGAKPIYINPVYDEEKGLLTIIEATEVQRLLKKYPKIKGAIIVSPTYEGVLSNITQITNVLHEQEKFLIVDEAHGAHFVLDDYFPMSSLECGADLVIQSMHKTLPTLTQSALLHIGTDYIEKSEIIEAIRMVQTSSPSYAMMGTMDYMRAYMEEHIEAIKTNYIEELINARAQLKQLCSLKLIENSTDTYDAGKIVIDTRNADIDGYQLGEKLEDKYEITCEAASSTHTILMTTVADNRNTLNYLVRALQEIDKNLCSSEVDALEDKGENPYKVFSQIQDTYTVSPRMIHYREKQELPIDKCEGMICTQHIMMYPPGIPIVCIGEKIKNEHIELIKRWKDRLKGISMRNNEIICKVAIDTLE